MTDAAQAAIAAIEARRAGGLTSGPIELGPEEYDAVRLFYRLGTQWRRVGMDGVRTGLDYAAVERTAAMMDLAMTPDLFDDIGVMERAALAVFAR